MKVSTHTITSPSETQARVRPDSFDRVHFNRWCAGQRIDRATKKAMWLYFSDEPDFWGSRGWSALLTAIQSR